MGPFRHSQKVPAKMKLANRDQRAGTAKNAAWQHASRTTDKLKKESRSIRRKPLIQIRLSNRID